jgi:hypothetical protein
VRESTRSPEVERHLQRAIDALHEASRLIEADRDHRRLAGEWSAP